ncbi:uncharacterized protein LOC114302845 [Camellia sinensis]|uniref:uncharacterized protein LOC114302845 n=1 Tax=Camellia sinensis TaxID=4442 RepID=UPI001036B847|nr:uncharacterized protein LOC114302845 [Camellia sinensis]
MTDSLHPGQKITTSLFNGQNYLAWSQSLTIFLKSKGKMEYVDGRVQAPNITDTGYDQWEITNSLIMGSLIHSMVPEIGEGYLSMDTAQDIWEAVATTYSRKVNFSQTFELRRSIDRSVQGEMTILQYFTFLSNGWKRLDHLQDYKPVCPTDSAGYRKFVEQVRVFKFLEGLNVEFDPVRSRMLGMDALSSLQEVFAYVQNEESRRSTMLPAASFDQSALVSAPLEIGIVVLVLLLRRILSSVIFVVALATPVRLVGSCIGNHLEVVEIVLVLVGVAPDSLEAVGPMPEPIILMQLSHSPQLQLIYLLISRSFLLLNWRLLFATC